MDMNLITFQLYKNLIFFIFFEKNIRYPVYSLSTSNYVIVPNYATMYPIPVYPEILCSSGETLSTNKPKGVIPLILPKIRKVAQRMTDVCKPFPQF